MSSSQAEFSFIAVLRSALRTLPSRLHWIFLLFAIPQVIFLALWTPPFQVADEAAHFERAWLVVHLELGPSYGGNVDAAIGQLWDMVAGFPMHPDAHYTADLHGRAESLQWAGNLTYRGFPNTGSGAPTGYIVSALGIVIGRAVGLGPWRTVELVRLLNGAFAIAVCAFALYWCGRGRLVMFALLLMPMSLSLFASCGQDATLIAFACVAFATISRQLSVGAPLSNSQTAIVIVSLIIVLVGRPPYVALLAVLLAPGLFKVRGSRRPWISGAALACVPFTISVAWWLAATHIIHEVAHPTSGIGLVSPKLQLINLLHYPGNVLGLIGYALQHIGEDIAGVIGYLGWLDTLMPGLYYLAMFLVLAMAAIAEMSQGPRIAKSYAILSIVGFFAGVVAVFMVEYLIWTPVGAAAIYGVQGRYFIPLLIAAAVGLPQLDDSAKAYQRLTAMVVAAQIITVVVLPKVIFARFYGG
jgi:uncharacterized membrane protein